MYESMSRYIFPFFELGHSSTSGNPRASRASNNRKAVLREILSFSIRFLTVTPAGDASRLIAARNLIVLAKGLDIDALHNIQNDCIFMP
jgi:hypothetical protein